MAGWTALPPVELRGTGTAMVESTSFYAVRLAWISGIKIRQIVMLINKAAGRVSSDQHATVFSGLSKTFEIYIDGLEKLTGVKDLRCGSFWVIRETLSIYSLGKVRERRRWCSECYLAWDVNESWEPLIWDIAALTDCPIHGCEIEDACRDCGAIQTATCSYQMRRFCHGCGGALGRRGRVIERANFQRWVNKQACEIVELCTSPGQHQIPADTYRKYIQRLWENVPSGDAIPSFLKDAIRLSAKQEAEGEKTSLRKMINMCALQAVGVVEMLRDPVAASSKCLINLWDSFEELPLAFGAHTRKAFAFGSAARALLKLCPEGQLPPADLVLRAIKMNEDLARELHGDVYARYQARYRSQGTATQRLHSRRALLVCLELLRERNRVIGRGKRKLTIELGKRAKVSPQVAHNAVSSAIWFRRIVKRVAKLMMEPRAEAVEDPIWLKLAAPERAALSPR